MVIDTITFDTPEESGAYLAGIAALSDMVLDYGGVSVRTAVKQEDGKYTVTVTSLGDDEEDKEDEVCDNCGEIHGRVQLW